MSAVPPAFDRAVGLDGMLHSVPRRALEAAMAGGSGDAWRICDLDGIVLRAGPQAFEGEVAEAPLVVDIEKVGVLVLPAARKDWLGSARKWLELLLGASSRYRMAADLHIEAVHADHVALMEKHAALEASEARYRAINSELEMRVQEQVALIEQSQRRMYQAEKMASIGNLAAGVAHEINNPIGFIRSNLSTAGDYVATLRAALAAKLEQEGADGQLAWVLEDFASLLAESIGGADRVARIVSDLKAYASSANAPDGRLDVNEAARAAIAQLGPLPAHITLEQELGAVPVCAGDREGLCRVLHALLVNACTAMRQRAGAIRVRTASDGKEVSVRVSDDGCGMAPDVLRQIFDPFFTTHDVGAGIGLGLTVASDIVRAHRGRIDVVSTVGEGSVFDVRLPLAAVTDEKA